MPKKRKTKNKCKIALRKLMNFVVSGRRYESKNPYLIPEVAEGAKALGYASATDYEQAD